MAAMITQARRGSLLNKKAGSLRALNRRERGERREKEREKEKENLSELCVLCG
jgi:hypothetical protein